MSLAYSSVTTANVALGYGRHADALSPERLVQVSLINYIDFALGIVSFSLPKLAVAALLNRIVNPNRFQKAALWVLTGLVALTSGICIVVLFTMCDPPRALWETSLVLQGAAECRSTWILVDYAIFTGGKLDGLCYASMILIFRQRSLHSQICILQSIRVWFSCD